ncbi:MAG: hypothetical protein AAFX55_20420 [Bacteroidota bacterium]
MNKLFAISIALFFFLSLSSDLQRKRIRQGDFDIECYVYTKTLEGFNKKKEYYWFKSGEVHSSYANAGGLLLHDEFKKFYRSKQLAQHGFFNYGLKNGTWRDWYENGKVKSVTNWNNGYKSGKYYQYDQSGALILSGTFRRGIKANQWINHKTADTTYYKNDSVYSEKPQSKTSKFLNNIFRKRDSTEIAQRQLERTEKRRQDSIKRASRILKRQQRRHQDSIKRAERRLKRQEKKRQDSIKQHSKTED